MLQAVRYAPGCRVEDLVLSCPGFTWCEVFEALVRLNRNGRLQLLPEQPGHYRVKLKRRRLATGKHR